LSALPSPLQTAMFPSSPYPSTVTLATFTGLFRPDGVHVLSFALCWGVNVWQSFSGPIAFKVSSSSSPPSFSTLLPYLSVPLIHQALTPSRSRPLLWQALRMYTFPIRRFDLGRKASKQSNRADLRRPPPDPPNPQLDFKFVFLLPLPSCRSRIFSQSKADPLLVRSNSSDPSKQPSSHGTSSSSKFIRSGHSPSLLHLSSLSPLLPLPSSIKS